MRTLRSFSLLFLVWLTSVQLARAQEPLVLADKVDGKPLGLNALVLEDKSRTLSIDEIVSPSFASEWKRNSSASPSFGFNQSAFWLRLEVVNDSARHRNWMLEVAYSHLDHISLYLPGERGFSVREAGDGVPFDRRELSFRNVVFSLEEPATSRRFIYVRVQTSGSANIPLVAWTPIAFLEHQNRELAGYWLFYGVMMIMAVYNLFIYLFVRTREYLYYVLYNVSLLLFEFTLNGHTFQYLLPNQIWLANHMVPFTIGVNYVWTSLFAQEYLKLREHNPPFAKFARAIAWCASGLSIFGLFGPYALTIRVLVVTTIVMTGFLPAAALPLLRQGHRQARLYLIAWSALIAGVLIYVAKTLGLIPSNWVTDWGIQIGAGLEVTLLSLALADRINTMRAGLSQLNAQLSQNVIDLKLALEQAEAGTRAKLGFLATVSHELRTPLNAIINIPEGLLKDFPRVMTAECQVCRSMFELEANDYVDRASACPECKRIGTLRLERTTYYHGQPERTARNLEHIERSGKHLLQMVNGILDFSKVDAGKLALSLDRMNVLTLVEETVDQLRGLAERSNVELVYERGAHIEQLEEMVGDQVRIRQVLINLIGNAIKFSDGKGRVTVSAARHQEACVLTVRDQGIGIAPEDCARVFESFEQVHTGDTRKYGGTGLGLSICKALVALHEGRIWVDSQVGVGSTFYVSLPIAGPVAVQAPANDGSAPSIAPNAKLAS